MKQEKQAKINVSIPSGVQIQIHDSYVKAKGPKGETEKELVNPRFQFQAEGQEFSISLRPGLKSTQEDKKIMNTFRAHVRNLVNGVQHGYVAKLKICSGHFPMTVSSEKDTLVIKNFLGEKVPRHASLVHDVSVKVQGSDVIVTGINRESVGQTAARIEQACRITNRDRRIFQDGIWLTEKTKVQYA